MVGRYFGSGCFWCARSWVLQIGNHRSEEYKGRFKRTNFWGHTLTKYLQILKKKKSLPDMHRDDICFVSIYMQTCFWFA